jgi:hypothetical protein
MWLAAAEDVNANAPVPRGLLPAIRIMEECMWLPV